MDKANDAITADALGNGNETGIGASNLPEQVETTAAVNPIVAEADAAFLELQEAAKSSNELLAQLHAEGVEIPVAISKDTMTPEQKRVDDEIRRKRNSDKALKALTQRKRGVDELNKTYTGAMTMAINMKLNDLSVASVATRFLGQIDKAYFVITRRGERAIGAAKTEEVLERMDAQIEEFLKESQDERAQVKVLLDAQLTKFNDENVGDDGMWLTPSYQSSAVEQIVHLKHPNAIKFVKGLNNFDALIHDLTVLQWNGVVDKNRVDQIRLRQNRLASKAFMFSISALNGMYNKMGRA